MNKYIDLAKEKHGVSQNGLANLLGIAPSYLSQMKLGSVGWSDEAIVKLAEACEIAPERLKAEYELEKATSKEVKSMWERIAGTAAVYALMGVSALLLTVERSGLVYILCKILGVEKTIGYEKSADFTDVE